MQQIPHSLQHYTALDMGRTPKNEDLQKSLMPFFHSFQITTHTSFRHDPAFPFTFHIANAHIILQAEVSVQPVPLKQKRLPNFSSSFLSPVEVVSTLGSELSIGATAEPTAGTSGTVGWVATFVGAAPVMAAVASRAAMVIVLEGIL